MGRQIMYMLSIILMLGIISVHVHTARADGPEVVTTQGSCTSIKFEEIPVANFNVELVKPLLGATKGWRRTQRYNAKETDPDVYIDKNGVAHPGHNGVDAGGDKTAAGIESFHACFDGKVLISTYKSGWGNSTVVVARLNAYSEELITIHFHHQNDRFVAFCDVVAVNQVIGTEGQTGADWPVHLHFTVRHWANLDHLLHWMNSSNGEYKIFGGGGYFGYNGIEFKGSYEPGAENIKEGSPYYKYGFLSPEPLLFNFFTDYELDENGNSPPYFELYPYARQMRMDGIEFGNWDGSYGAGNIVHRREMARWVKIAGEFPSEKPATAMYADMPTDDPDFPYVEALVRNPAKLPTLNIDANVINGIRYFYADIPITRAEAMKMIVTTFFWNDYLNFYNGQFWEIKASLAIPTLSQMLGIPQTSLFQDVDINEWYAPYVYYGVYKGLVASGSANPNFRPGDGIVKAEIAKWVILARNDMKFASGPCSKVCCPDGYYCDVNTENCREIPYCISKEYAPCEVGGGYDPCSDPQCQPGEKQQQVCTSGGNSGLQERICTIQCQWGDWANCSVQSPLCQCSSGMCCDGCNYKTSSTPCNSWTEYRCQGTSSGQDAQYTTITQYCSGSTNSCDGQTTQTGWQTLQDCTSQQTCVMSGSTPTCQNTATCSDTYILSGTSACWNGNLNGVEICLNVKKKSGSVFQYQLCKDTEFLNDFDYRLIDLKHDNQNPLHSSTGESGITCTDWQTVDFGYLTGYGTSNGATLRGDIYSPSGCTSASCLYRSAATITVTKQCL